MVGHLTPTDPAFTQQLHAAQAMLARHSDPVTAMRQAYALIYSSLNQQAHLWAFVDTFRVFALLVLCCLPLILLFRRVRQAPARQVELA